jgi:hypothetical protein
MLGWELICDGCANGMEIKTIGIMQRPPASCAACGKELSTTANGFADGKPVRPEQVSEARDRVRNERGRGQ